MGILKPENNAIEYSSEREFIILEPFGENSLRFRSSAAGRPEDIDRTLLKQKTTAAELTEYRDRAVIKNGSLSAELYNNGRLIFRKDGEELIASRGWRPFNDPLSRDYRHIGGNFYSVRVDFKAYPDEHFYGLGQEYNGMFDLKGSAIDLLHRNTKSTIPFVYSSRGYGFLWNNPSIGRAELCNNRTSWTARETRQIDFIVTAGDTPAYIMKRYAEMTGFAPRFPEWAAGFWQSKLRYVTQEETLEVAREYKRRGLPISAIVIDYFHWTQQGDWKFDPEYWPDPKAMVDELRGMGIEPVVSIWPTVHPESENFKEMSERQLLVRTERGPFNVFNFHGPVTHLDATNPETREFVWDVIKRNYFDYGIKTFWLDEAEPELSADEFENLRYHLGNGAQCSQIYPYYYQKLLADGLKKEGIDDICILTRCAWLGSQRQHALVWSGDIPSTFESLRYQILEGQHMAMSGIPWWNSDIGGFWGGVPADESYRELIVRWFQFGLFCPVMRVHGNRSPLVESDLMEKSGQPNEVWSYGDEVYPILKNILELRERLRPYIMRQTEIASETGTPIIRPMFYSYGEEICYTLGDQYMFGEDILFAPIYNEGQTEREVYLPKGEIWIDTRSGREYEGGTTLKCSAKLDEFIAFVRAGAKVSDVF